MARFLVPLLLLVGCDLINPPQPVDADRDGSVLPDDCDDALASVHPGAEEVCGDGVDQDCDGNDLVCE